MDFENPIPEDETEAINNAVNLFKAGIITRNDALEMVSMELLETPEGEEYAPSGGGGGLGGLSGLFPPPKMPVESTTADEEALESEKPTKALVPHKAILITESERESFWKDYVGRAESYEAKTISELQMMYLQQKQEALSNLEQSTDKNVELIDLKAARLDYVERMTPILSQIMSMAIKNGLALVEPVNPHKQGEPIPVMLSPEALKWLRTRIGWAADQINEETATRLSQVLAQGYEEGMSIPQIADRISAEFDYFSDYRAERIARTEIIQASAQGAIEGYKDTGVVEKVEFYCALDERTCTACMGLHKERFTLSDSEGVITVHPNCRCVWLPVVEI